MVRQLLHRRGIAHSPTFRMDIPNFAEAPADAPMDARLSCASEQDFQARLQHS